MSGLKTRFGSLLLVLFCLPTYWSGSPAPLQQRSTYNSLTDLDDLLEQSPGVPGVLHFLHSGALGTSFGYLWQPSGPRSYLLFPLSTNIGGVAAGPPDPPLAYLLFTTLAALLWWSLVYVLSRSSCLLALGPVRTLRTTTSRKLSARAKTIV